MLETRPITVGIGRWSVQHQPIVSRIPARAPYVRIGPLLADWTMSALVNNRPMEQASLPGNRATVGMLRRISKPGRLNTRLGWQLYLECALADGDIEAEEVCIYVGPRGQPAAAWRITADGQISNAAGAGQYGDVADVQTRVLSDRWILQVTLPEHVFNENGNLMLGITRTDGEGVHSAWPRRMIPGQDEPGRLIITPTEFDELRVGGS